MYYLIKKVVIMFVVMLVVMFVRSAAVCALVIELQGAEVTQKELGNALAELAREYARAGMYLNEARVQVAACILLDEPFPGRVVAVAYRNGWNSVLRRIADRSLPVVGEDILL